MRSVVRAVLGVLIALVSLVGVMLVNTVRNPSRQIAVQPLPALTSDTAAVAKRLATAITYKTVSFAPSLPTPVEEFKKLHAYLAESFPKTHAALEREVVSTASLLFTWKGSDPTAPAAILMAHQDVVPVAPGTDAQWTHPPFDGKIADGFIWGRGAWDDKGAVLAIFEAVEQLVLQGFKPKGTIYLAFGHDEEIGGQGAQAIAALLKSRNVKTAFALDEGLLVTQGLIGGIDAPVALIGLAEKGYVTLQLTAKGTPGHSSIPPSTTVIGTLARAIATLEANPFPADLKGLGKTSYETLAPEFGGIRRVLLSNLWLTAPVVAKTLEGSPATNALMRTTTAPTILRAGEKDNVLPGIAEAAVNFRISPGDTVASVTARVKSLVGPSVEVTAPAAGNEPTSVSSADAAAYSTIAKSIREVFPGAVVAPSLMLAGTDSKHMAGIADNTYRFNPVRAKPEDLGRFHGTNERIAITNYLEMIQFYHRLITNLQ